jgi:hypothetical protein
MIHRSRTADMPLEAPEKPAQGFLFALKPDYGGTFMTAPFTDAMMPEVCARVVFRLVARRARKWAPDEMSGTAVTLAVLDDIAPLRGTLVYSCALAALFALRNQQKLARWRDTAILHSRAGLGFRRCWYDDYKANRRDPRVTNRGVRLPR